MADFFDVADFQPEGTFFQTGNFLQTGLLFYPGLFRNLIEHSCLAVDKDGPWINSGHRTDKTDPTKADRFFSLSV